MYLVRLTILAILLSPFCVASNTLAQETGISVSHSSAVAEFPTGITFNVKAESASPIIKAELLYTKAELETFNLASAQFEPSAELEASLPVDFRNNYVPAGIEVTYLWRLTNSDGDVLETEPGKVNWTDTRFNWIELSSDQVSVFTYTESEEFSRAILDSAQSTIDRLQTDFNVERSRRIRLWVYDSKSDFQGSQAPNSQEWIAGTAYPELQVILAVLPEGNEREVGRVVPHEISHQVLHQAAQNPFNAPPTWLDEGLAVAAQDNGNDNFQAQVERASDDGRLFSVRSLNSEFPFDPADASLAYAESYSVIRFIIDRWGNEGIAKLIAAYETGVSHDEAAVDALGVDLTGLDELWKESLGYQGNSGIAGGTSADDQTGGVDLIGNATSVLLVLVAVASVVAMILRSRRNRDDDASELMLANQFIRPL